MRKILKTTHWATILVFATFIIPGIALIYLFCRPHFKQQNSPSTSSIVPIVAVTALGRVEPQGEVVHLFGGTPLEGARVAQLLVKQGDRVGAGQVVAILDNYTRRLADLKQAQKQVSVAQARLAQIQIGAKMGDISAQKAAIARFIAELHNAQAEYRRYQGLFQTRAVSASLRDSKRLQMETIAAQLSQAKAALRSLAEVRPVDVKKAQAEVESALAAVEQAQANLDLAYVRTRMNGQILKIRTRPGEAVSDKGIVDLGQTDEMYVIAEIDETDIGKVHLNQRASVTSGALTGKLQGTLAQIDLQIREKDIFSTERATELNTRVVEVKIRLDPTDSQRVKALTNLEVEVVIKV